MTYDSADQGRVEAKHGVRHDELCDASWHLDDREDGPIVRVRRYQKDGYRCLRGRGLMREKSGMRMGFAKSVVAGSHDYQSKSKSSSLGGES